MLGSTFKSFYQKAKNKADEALNAVADNSLNYDRLSMKAVAYMYKNIPAEEKNSFFYVTTLNTTQMELINSEKPFVRLSIESFAKNIIRHPEISFEEYLLMPEIIDKTELLIYLTRNHNEHDRILCFSWNGRYYKATIKSTAKKDDNYLVSFHSISMAGIKRDKKKKGARIIYDNLTKKQTIH